MVLWCGLKLEKAHETVWSVKRRDKPGKFECRFTEMDGVITRITIALEKKGERIEFEMAPNEFESFFGILTNFRETVSAPSSEFYSSSSYQDHFISTESPIAQPQTSPQISPQTSLQAPLQTQTQNQTKSKPWTPSSISDSSSMTQSDQDEIDQLLKDFAETKPSSPKLSSENGNTSTMKDFEEIKPVKKERLKETDWDPW